MLRIATKQLGIVSPELRRHRATIAQLGVIVAITVEDYYAQGEAVLAAAPRKNVKEHEMLRLYPAGVYRRIPERRGYRRRLEMPRFQE